MDSSESLTETERLLLMAAAVQGLGPQTDLERANTVKVVSQVLRWKGLSDEESRSGWDDLDESSVRIDVYETLIRMTHQTHRVGPGRPPERAGEPLFEGGGNWGVPGDPNHPACSPYYNACRLTPRGRQVAETLLSRHPEYGDQKSIA